jgi:hypothetical protein
MIKVISPSVFISKINTKMRKNSLPIIKILSIAFVFILQSSLSFSQSKMGVNLSHEMAFVNIIDESLRFNNATSYDAQGWPKSDFTLVFDWRLATEWAGTIDDPEQYRIKRSGIYKCSFEGQADLSGITISDKNYNPLTNITTFYITIPETNEGGIFWQLSFSNSKRNKQSSINTGITKLKINRPGYDLNTSQVLTNEYIRML